MSKSSVHRHAIGALLAACASAGIAHAAVIDAFWLGGTGSWHDPTKWSTGVVPNNGGGNTYRAFISSGSVNTQFSPTITIDALTLNAAAALRVRNTLNLQDTAAINGTVQIDFHGVMKMGLNASLTGNGIVNVGNEFSDLVSLTSSGALEIGSGLTVRAGLGATVGTRDRPFVNHGFVFGGAPVFYSTIIAGTPFNNLGVIEARAGELELDGSFNRADLGNLVWGSGGIFTIRGTLLNQGQTFYVDDAHGGDWQLRGAIVGGTLQIAPGHTIDVPYYSSATLEDVVVNGSIRVVGNAPLYLKNGMLSGNADIYLGGTALEGPCRLTTSTSPTLTISSSAIVHGGGGVYSGTPEGDASGVGSQFGATSVVNHGTIRADTPGTAEFPGLGEFDLIANSFINDGRLAIGSTSFMYATKAQFVPATLTFAAGGILDIDMSADPLFGLLRVNGTLDLSTAFNSLQLNASAAIVPFTFYRIATATTVLGQFDSVTAGFELMYTPTEIFARVVPEPAVLSAAGALYFINRRRKER